MKVLVCGSRSWENLPRLFAELDRIVGGATTSVVITGGADGADTLADGWAKNRKHDRIICPANWKRHGRAAGPIRNRLMLDLGPEMVIAFRDGDSPGTRDCIDEAERRGIPIEVIS